MSKTKGEEKISYSELDTSLRNGDEVEKQTAQKNISNLIVNRFSEREASRELAAICALLQRTLRRDFGIHDHRTITIVPSEKWGVQLRITRRD